MPGPEHELTARTFDSIIKQKITDGGQEALIQHMGSTQYDGTYNAKEADASFKPLRARPGRLDWPTVILEVGVSEKPRRSSLDAKWWIENSGGAIRVVLLFFVNLSRKTIRIEMWKKDTIDNPQHTRDHNQQEVTGPTLKQTINITPTGITGAPLVLSFRDIFLRRRKKRRGENNYIITEDDIQKFYNLVWLPDVTSESESSAEEDQSSHSSDNYVVD
ncbi:hypothetical protein B9Z19DRAFT_1069681 [Tuber borchii]|uniref:Uncharacterized protein n=1 Tax=Tuber borchii TaxID=42251 RepID=A0A2T6ZAV8_TUBBO|nr:hypothetical protein B9Z19DRAFT_1069681 [Tuber borchii]